MIHLPKQKEVPKNENNLLIAILFFVAPIAAYLIFSASASYKAMGLSVVYMGGVWICNPSIPVGLENKPPEFHITGKIAKVFGFITILLGIALIYYSFEIACALNSNEVKGCYI
jgi:hypothetical protein